MKELEKIAVNLYRIGAVKIGDFTLKNGAKSPVYIDLRLIISDPDLLQSIADLIWRTGSDFNCSLVCGVPYTALPIATAVSLKNNIPMVLRRKEIKDYGTKKRVEGIFSRNQTCLIIEDVMTTGASILETCEILREEGLIVREALVFIDREAGGKANLAAQGIIVKSVFTLRELVSLLERLNILGEEEYKNLKKLAETVATEKNL